MLTRRVVMEAAEVLLGEPVRSAEAWAHPQRHESWRVTTCAGDRCWLKVAASRSPVAGVDHEADVLNRLQGRHHTPVLVACEPGSYLVTAELPGQTLSNAAPGVVGGALPAVAAWLKGFADANDLAPYPDGTVATWDVFGPTPDIDRLLADGRDLWDQISLRHAPMWRRQSTPTETGSVHGSFDASNVLVDGREVSGVVDLEAARVGPVAIDVASLAASLLLEGRLDAARRWLDIWIDGRPQDVHLIAGFLQLRLWFRHQADAVPQGFTEAVVGLVRDLERRTG